MGYLDGFKVTLAGDYQNSPDSNGGGWQANYCGGPTLCPSAPQYGIYAFLLGGTTGAGVFGAAANTRS